jgi:DNA-directed RNA polymerase subunit RPC12/RpoP
MDYYCLRCKKIVELTTNYQGIRCPYCGYRALKKERPEVVVKKVKAE